MCCSPWGCKELDTTGLLKSQQQTTRTRFIRVKDAGCGIEDVEKAMEPLYTTAPEEERSGLGFSVMSSFMDRLSVRSKVGRGTTVTMRKRLAAHDD